MILTKDSKRQVDIDFILNEKIRNKKLNEVIIIVPTNRRVRSLKRELISLSPNKSSAQLHVNTLATLCISLFQESANRDFILLSDATAVVLLNKCFNQQKLKYFSSYSQEIPAGTLEKLKSVISEYKRSGVTPNLLFQQADNLTGSEKKKALDIANIFESYLTECRQRNLFEIGDIYHYLNQLPEREFQQSFTNFFKEVNLVFINGFDELTNPEIEMINKIASIKGLETIIQLDYYKQNPALFSHLDECYTKLIDRGFIESIDLSPSVNNKFFKLVRENLFLSSKKNAADDYKIEVHKIEAQSPEKEIEIIAKELKNLLIKENIPVEKICLAFNKISDHSKIVRDVFPEFGLPFNLTDRFALSESPPVISIINLLEIADNNFYYKNIFRALSGKWINIEQIDLSNLLRVASNLKIIFGYKTWIEKIDNAIEELKLGEDRDYDSMLPAHYYERAKEDIKKLEKLLKPFIKENTIRDFWGQLQNLLLELQIVQRILNDQTIYTERNVRAVTEFLKTLKEIFELLEIEYNKDSKFPLSFYLKNIKSALQFTRYNVREKINAGVLVTSINEIRGLKFDYLFIGGLTDGEFPTRYQPEIFFSGSFKKNEYKHVLEERYHFYQALCTVNKKLYLTYPTNDEKKEFTTSTFVNDLSKVLEIKNINADTYNDYIYSKMELLRKIDKSSIESNETKKLLEKLFKDPEKLINDFEIDELRLTDPFAESEYTGNIQTSLSAEAKLKLEEEKNKKFSASQLELYAKCPFQYFLKRILKIDTVPEPTEEIEAFELGSLIHSILYEFYKNISEQNITVQNCDEKMFAKLQKMIFKIAEEKSERIQFNSPFTFFEREKIFGIDGNRNHSILYKFLEAERNNKDGFIPSFFETEFGNENNTISDVTAGDIKLRGKIDRIDIDNAKANFKVIDYKLGGRKPGKEELTDGISLQLPLYIYASKKLLDAEFGKNLQPASADIYSLKISGTDFGRKQIHILRSNKPGEEEIINSNVELINIFLEFVPRYVDNISKGVFNLSTLKDRENKICRFCDFKSICRIQEADGA